MKPKLIFLSLLLVVVGGQKENCGEEKAKECWVQLLHSLLEKESNEDLCDSLNVASDCMKEADGECTEGRRNWDIHEGRRELSTLILENCPVNERETPMDIAKCIHGLEEELKKCATTGAIKILEKIWQQPVEAKVDENEIKCSMYQFVTKCVVQKVKDSCGRGPAVQALLKMLITPSRIRRSCNQNGIRRAFNNRAYDIMKKRK